MINIFYYSEMALEIFDREHRQVRKKISKIICVILYTNKIKIRITQYQNVVTQTIASDIFP